MPTQNEGTSTDCACPEQSYSSNNEIIELSKYYILKLNNELWRKYIEIVFKYDKDSYEMNEVAVGHGSRFPMPFFYVH